MTLRDGTPNTVASDSHQPSPGCRKSAVKISLYSANQDVDEHAEVTVALKNPEQAVEKMLKTLAQRFPPESVMTIQPTHLSPSTSSNSSSLATSQTSSGRRSAQPQTVETYERASKARSSGEYNNDSGARHQEGGRHSQRRSGGKKSSSGGAAKPEDGHRSGKRHEVYSRTRGPADEPLDSAGIAYTTGDPNAPTYEMRYAHPYPAAQYPYPADPRMMPYDGSRRAPMPFSFHPYGGGPFPFEVPASAVEKPRGSPDHPYGTREPSSPRNIVAYGDPNYPTYYPSASYPPPPLMPYAYAQRPSSQQQQLPPHYNRGSSQLVYDPEGRVIQGARYRSDGRPYDKDGKILDGPGYSPDAPRYAGDGAKIYRPEKEGEEAPQYGIQQYYEHRDGAGPARNLGDDPSQHRVVREDRQKHSGNGSSRSNPQFRRVEGGNPGDIELKPGFGTHVETLSNGDKIRYVEVDVVEEKIIEVPVTDVREVERVVKVPEYRTVEKVEEVPEIEWRDREVSVVKEELVVKEVPVKQIVDVPTTVVREVEVIVPRIEEKIVEIPEIIEVEKPYNVENRVTVPVYSNREVPTMVAQKLCPILRESTSKTISVNTKTYEPVLYAVNVYLPKPVPNAIIANGKIDESHQIVQVPPAHYNSLISAMNNHLEGEALQQMFVRSAEGQTPMLPPGQVAAFVAPKPGALPQFERRVETAVTTRESPSGHRALGRSSHRSAKKDHSPSRPHSKHRGAVRKENHHSHHHHSKRH